ncbi:ABC transporter substrate-binding protein [Bdellovibrio sp. SKB1291214]|uniref:ABC transporter substrate-binding protein n=1 Tax=Bdellovibrio sp. SKB1291214 TaxID=1732569 RepID=UPI000B51A75D|nr:ABC transporter substrate-binding protein [Bdellovibrio sp. SKB1291214]UYL09940.1 ABC transporter substrate-binding protein [Bdellovibrio sp. SKB1291214]
MRLPKVALLVLAMAFTGCTKKSDDIKVGVYGPFTGGSAPMGISMRNGVQVAIDEINAAGGVLGKRISMVDRDDEPRMNGVGKLCSSSWIKRK